MIPGLPSPTIILATAFGFVLATGGAYLAGNHFGHKAERIVWEKAIAEQKADAAQKLAEVTENVRKKEAEDAETARKVDEAHAAELALAHAGRDDFAERLRIARRGARCPNPGSAEAPNTRVSADVAESSIDGPGSPDPGNRLRDAALELQAYARACHSWAWEVGR